MVPRTSMHKHINLANATVDKVSTAALTRSSRGQTTCLIQTGVLNEQLGFMRSVEVRLEVLTDLFGDPKPQSLHILQDSWY